jgi:uncharacterized protein (TIGR00251 family)
MAKLKIQEHDGFVTIDVHVIPRSSKSEIIGQHDGALKVKLKALPVEGAANDELIDLLSKQFGASRSDIDIISGRSSKKKRIRISGTDLAKILIVLKQKT